MKNCGHTVPCGCGDQPLATPPPCSQLGPCAGEPCAELFCEECIVHCQPDISVTDDDANTITITQGMRADEILQTLLVYLTAPACVGVSAVGLQLVNKTATTMTIRWAAVAGVNYTITWQEGLNIYTAAVHDVSQYEIINLIPGTTYTIKIVTEAGPCESVLMTVQTNPLP